MSKTAIVTGGAGFIGSHAVDCLIEQGFDVRVLDNMIGGREQNLEQHRNSKNLAVDQRDIRSVPVDDKIFKGCEFMIHFAGIGDIVPSIDAPLEYMSTNVQGTVAMLEGARHAKMSKFVYAASSSCYGLATELPTTESAPIHPMYPYALSKYQGEQAALHWQQVYRLPVSSIRIFNAYGPRSRTSGAYGAVFGVFLKQKLANKPYTVVGDGAQRRDFVFVTDVARAFVAAAHSKISGGIYNIGAGDPQSVNRLIELLGGEAVEYLPKRPGEPDCTWADISRAKRELNWHPQVSFEQGVAAVVTQIEYWRDAPLWDRSSIEKATAGWFAALQNSK